MKHQVRLNADAARGAIDRKPMNCNPTFSYSKGPMVPRMRCSHIDVVMLQRGTRMGSILTLMACLRIRHSSKPSHELKIIFPRAGTVHMTSMQISFRLPDEIRTLTNFHTQPKQKINCRGKNRPQSSQIWAKMRENDGNNVPSERNETLKSPDYGF